jgi:hypothetical protein
MRPIYKLAGILKNDMITKTKINFDSIKNLDIKQIDELVYNKAVDIYLGTFGENFKELENDRLLKAVFATTVLDAEVKNGGFDQFFLNSYDLADYALIGLKHFNADEHAEILNEAIEIFDEQKEKYSEKRNPYLDPCDAKYYELEDIALLRQKFIADNIEKFLD